jgi:gamma-glutamyltranspeptidase / glutathione hydrolase
MAEAMITILRCLALLFGLVTLPSTVFAHRLDEYLQATLVAIEPSGFRLHINLTPGVEVAKQVLAVIDRDHDGVISTNEAAGYSELLKRDLIVRLDQRNVELKVTASNFPSTAELRTGLAIIQMEFSVTPSPLVAGAHKFTLENRHLPTVSVYLFNAAQPKSGSVQIITQKRNANQSAGEIEFAFSQSDALATPIVVAANPLAAKAGMDILKKGGTAVDAAVAVQAALGLVEPQSSGLGGGGFMIYYDARTGEVTAYDGREVAPMSADGNLFMHDGKPLSRPEAYVSGRATGVPGAVIMLDQAHKDHGKLAWQDLFDESIKLAEAGFPISPRLGNFIQSDRSPESKIEDYRNYLSNGHGGLKTTGDLLKNPAYAETLKSLAKNRSAIFRSGPLVDQIIARSHQGPLGGDLQPWDFVQYRSRTTKAVIATYRGYTVCVPQPSSSGVSLQQGLLLLERFPLGQWGKDDPRSWSALIEAEKLMYADRDQYVADTKFVNVPVRGLIDPKYIQSRTKLIEVGKPASAPKPGTPPKSETLLPDQTIEPGGTSHFVIIDRNGNAVSMTTTIENYFGTGRMVAGFFLNNQLTDFSFTPAGPDGQKAANAVEGGKRPRSSMSPVIVLDENHEIVAMVGSPGGSSILAYNLKTLVGMLDWGLSVRDAAALPNVVAMGDTLRIETSLMNPAVVKGLTDMRYNITPLQGEDSGIHGILRQADGSYEGGADPRREGVALNGNAQ